MPRIKLISKTSGLIAGIFLLAVLVGFLTLRWSVRTNAATTLKEAERAMRGRDNAKVRQTLKWLLWFEPNHSHALLLQGVSLNADRRFGEAIATFERIPEGDPRFEETEFALANSLIHDQQLDRAESILRQHLRRFPHSVAACEELVRLNIRLFRQRETITLLLDFWKRDRDNFGALPLLLELQVKRFTPREAVASLEAADHQHPNQGMVVLALARIYALMGKMDEAQAQFVKALRLSPNDFLTNLTAAEFYFNRGDVSSAKRLLNSETLRDAEDDRLWFLRSRLAEQSGQLLEANSALQKALALQPNEETYLLMEATVLRRLGRLEESRSFAKRATELAEIRKRLVILATEFNREHPSSKDCLEIADHLDRWGSPEQADAWRRAAHQIGPPQSGETIR